MLEAVNITVFHHSQQAQFPIQKEKKRKKEREEERKKTYSNLFTNVPSPPFSKSTVYT